MPSPNLTKLLETLKRCDAEMTKGPWRVLRLGHAELGPLVIAAPTDAAAYGLTISKEAHQEQTYVQVCADFRGTATLRNLVAAQAKIIEVAIGALEENAALTETRSFDEPGAVASCRAALADLESIAATKGRHGK